MGKRKKKKLTERKILLLTAPVTFDYSSGTIPGNSETLTGLAVIQPKKKFGTKIISAIVNKIPDGILLKVLSFGTRKLIGKIPEEKREKWIKNSSEFIIKLAGVLAEGAARGAAKKIRSDFNGGF